MLFLRSLKSLGSTFVLGFGFASMLALGGCGSDDTSTNGGGGGAYPRDVEIEYKVTSPGFAAADVIYENESGGNASESAVALPFSKKISRTVKQYDAAVINAQAEGGGQLDVEILVDGTSVEKKTFSATDVVVSGSVVYIFQ